MSFKFSNLMLALLIVALFFTMFGCDVNEKANEDGDYTYLGRSDYSHSMFASCKFTKISATSGRINDGEKEIACDYIFKYAHDSERYVGFHQITFADSEENNKQILYTRKDNGSERGVIFDVFCVYDSLEKEIFEFSSAFEMNSFCADNDIKLGIWHYPGGGQSYEAVQTEIMDGYNLENIGDYRGQTILKDGIPIYAGYIDKVWTDDEELIFFRLKIADSDFDCELLDNCNKGLSPLAKKKFNSYNVNFWLRFPVYYESYVALNIKTGEVNEFSSKREMFKYFATLNINQSWDGSVIGKNVKK